MTRLPQARFDEALEWLLICSTWSGGYLRVRLGQQPPHHCCYRQWRDRGQFGDLPGLVRALDEEYDDEVLLGLPVNRRGSEHVDTLSVLWARIEGEKQLQFAKKHRPLPSMILQEGTSTRRWLIWSLDRPVPWGVALESNRRLAYAFRGVQKHADPDTLWLPAPGTCLRDGRSRPVPVRVSRMTLDSWDAGVVVGGLKSPPEQVWMGAAAR